MDQNQYKYMNYIYILYTQAPNIRYIYKIKHGGGGETKTSRKWIMYSLVNVPLFSWVKTISGCQNREKRFSKATYDEQWGVWWWGGGGWTRKRLKGHPLFLVTGWEEHTNQFCGLKSALWIRE